MVGSLPVKGSIFMRALNMVFVVVFLAAASAAAQVAIRPGQYEVTLDLDLGIPKEAPQAVLDAAGFKKQKRLECFTAEDVKGGFVKILNDEAAEQNCKTSDMKTTGNRMTFTMTCQEDDVRMTMSTEMTFTGDSFSGVTKGKDPEGRMTTSRFSAKRVGDCQK
jgi:hypothetical protein